MLVELDYNTELEKIYLQIGESKELPIATSSKNNPTVRIVCCIIYDNKIYFQTGSDLLKYEQICENNNVALCFINIQIIGIAKIIGKTTDKENIKIMEIYKKCFPKSYETYSHYEKEILIEINPKKIMKWDYENGKPFQILLDIENKRIKKEMYF
jgi:uncharacterized pyridoxamine 5'-phosphate oxidase family protein